MNPMMHEPFTYLPSLPLGKNATKPWSRA